jgi:hypothetical protein
MQRRYSDRTGTRGFTGAAVAAGLCLAGIAQSAPALADRALADRVNETSRYSRAATAAQALNLSDYQPAFALDYARRGAAKDCQLPGVGTVSPFPLALRLGALVSPRLKFVGGIDATIPGVHLAPGLATRVDADAIISANLGGISTLIPVTIDQIAEINLPVSSRVYVGAGIGPYFGDRTRFGGKLIAGAEFSRIGLEGNLHFPGSGDTLFTIQARIGL